MWRKSKPASITVFLSMILAFVLAAVFSLLEAARVWGLEKKTATDAVQTSHSLMAEYTPELWDSYHLLFLDGSYGSGRFAISNVETRAEELSTENLDVHGGQSGQVTANTWNLYGIGLEHAKILHYELATDQGGAAFCREAAKVMEEEIGIQMLKSIYEYITDPKEDNENTLPAVVEETDKEIVLAENPADTVARIKENGLLTAVLPERAVSDKEMDLSEILSKRELQVGNYGREAWNGNWKDRILFHEYLLKYFSDCAHVDSGHMEEGKALDYELEYMLAGKASDRANLRSVVNQLILLREVPNLAYLETDKEKQEIALAAAAALASAALSPELIPVLKHGILAAWAYAESVSDVRLLLDGQKVSLVKTKEQWHTDLEHLEASIGKENEQKQEKGLTYEQYLHLLLWKTRDSTLAYRAMDLIEKNENLQMDSQISAFDGVNTYNGKPLFSAFVSIGRGKPEEYIFQKAIEGCYSEE